MHRSSRILLMCFSHSAPASGCRLGRRRGVSIGVGTVCTHYYETHGSRQSKEQTHAWLIDARGIRLGEAKPWSSALGSITAHASFTSSTRLNDVIPMGTQHRGTRWGRTRHAKDFLLRVSVTLFPYRGKLEIIIGSCFKLRRVKEPSASSSGVALPRM